MLYYALVFLVVSLIADALNLAGVSTVAAAECPATDLRDGGTIQGMPRWKATTFHIYAHSPSPSSGISTANSYRLRC